MPVTIWRCTWCQNMRNTLTAGTCVSYAYMNACKFVKLTALVVALVAHSVEKIARHNDPSQTKPAQHAAAGELEPYLSLDDAVNLLSNLAESLHRSGINIRMLGLVRWHCKLAISKSLLLAEIVARAARKEVRHMLRTASKASSVPTFTALNRYV